MDWVHNLIIGILSIVSTLLTTFIIYNYRLNKKKLKNAENKTFNILGSTKTIINKNSKETQEQHISKGVDLTNERLNKGDKRFDDIERKLDHLIIAFGIYVEGNGVSPETKKAVKTILKESKNAK